MNSPAISIIIPVYNAYLYLDQCLQSILEQTFKQWEAIVINDGSTDDSLSILIMYANKDSRIKIFHQENKGVSAARNKGLLHARGKFITFCDADDYISPVFLEDLYDKMLLPSVDLVICNAETIHKDKNSETRLQLTNESIDISSNRPVFLEKFMKFSYDYAN